METDQLVLYYPEDAKPEALRVAARLEYCRTQLMKLAPIDYGPGAGRKSVFVLPNVPFNNAYVSPSFSGQEQVAVLPMFSTFDYFLLLGLPPDPGVIGCHEMTHDVVMRQVSGFPMGLRYAFGELFSPEMGLEGWFQEGIAVYYETRMLGIGRLHNKYFEGNLAAGVAGRNISESLFNSFNRTPNFGHYLLGAHFVDYLMRLRGEKALWEVVDRQSNEFLFPFGISPRFKKVYGRSLSGLIDDFNEELKTRYPVRKRPADQRRVTEVGRQVVLGVSSSGRYAVLSYDLDKPATMSVYEANGTQVLSRHLTDLLVGRRLVQPSIEAMSGLSLTADGEQAFFVAIDRGPVYSQARLLHLDIDKNHLSVLEEDIGGAGGSVSPDGKYYYFTRPQGDSYSIYEYHVASHEVRQVTHAPPREFHSDPIVSPDGKTLIVTESSARGLRLALYDVESGGRMSAVLSPPDMTLQGTWVDAEHVVYAANDGERMQIFETDLRGARLRKLTEAPYLASEPFYAKEHVVFLNREGWNWTIDEIPYPSADKSAYRSSWVIPEMTTGRASPESVSHPLKSPASQPPEAEDMPETQPPKTQDVPDTQPPKTEDVPETQPPDVTPPAAGATGQYLPTTQEEQYGAFYSAPAVGQVVPAASPPEETAEESPAAASGAQEEPPASDGDSNAQQSAEADQNSAEAPSVAQDDAAEKQGEPAAAEQTGANPPQSETQGPAPWVSYSFTHRDEPQLADVNVISDRKYQPMVGFFRPRSWGPQVQSREESELSVGAAVGGGDDLGYNRWSLAASYDFVAKLPSVQLAWLNAAAAPYIFYGSYEYVGRTEKTLNDFTPAPDQRVQIQEHLASLMVGRSWYESTSLYLGARYVDALYTRVEDKINFEALRVVGPSVTFSHQTFETTAYTDARLGLAISGAASYYPAALSENEFELADVGGGLYAVFPLPLSRRHTLSLAGSGRALLGAPDSAKMLQVGGENSGAYVNDQPHPVGQRLPGLMPPGISFREPLRGFEDIALYGSEVVSGEIDYTFRFIADVGTTSTFYVLPSFFWRQVELNLFYSSATLFTDENDLAMAAGGALDFKIAFWSFPMKLRFQESRRITHDDKWSFYFAFGSW